MSVGDRKCSCLCPVHDLYQVSRAPKGTEFISEIPKGVGKVVDTCFFQDQYFVACEFAVFRLIDGELKPLRFKL